jgi:hypothetical protein
LHQVLAWNPCYVVSAAVLLFGAFSVTSDPAFRGHDLARLGFNFGSLQLYEALLIGTALFLARRAIWYDSLLLVTLENLLVLVPLILINEAALLDGWVVGVLCGAGAALALGRFGVLRRWMPQLNLPRGVLGVGAVILAVNLILPILFRHFHESKVGTRVTEGPAYELFQATWLVLLPLATALFWLVPLAGMSGSAGPRSRWFPPAFFLLWLAGTGVHAWSLGYVYDFEVLPRHLAPLLWTLGWLGWARLGEVWPARTERASFLVLLIPVLATFLTATADGLGAFRLLTSINSFSFAALILFRRGGHILWHLAAGSAIALLMTLPTGWVNLTRPTLLNLGRTELLLALVGCYLLIWVARSRRPLLAIVGAVIAASLAGGWFNGRPECVHLAAQTGLLFFLLHSLRWDPLGQSGHSACAHAGHPAVDTAFVVLGGAGGRPRPMDGGVFRCGGGRRLRHPSLVGRRPVALAARRRPGHSDFGAVVLDRARAAISSGWRAGRAGQFRVLWVGNAARVDATSLGCAGTP